MTPTTTPTQITIHRLREWSACADGREWFRKKFPEGGEYIDVMRALYADKKPDDANWLAGEILLRPVPSSVAEANVKLTMELAKGGASTSRDGAHSSTSGDGAHSSTSGDGAHSAASGRNSGAVALGRNSTVEIGPNGFGVLTWHDGNRTRTTTIYEGEDGIEAGVIYRLDESGRVVRA